MAVDGLACMTVPPEVDVAIARQSARDRRRARLQRGAVVLAVVSLAVTVGLLVAFVVFILGQSDQHTVSDRADCRAAINAVRRNVLDTLDLRLKTDTARDGLLLGDALLGSVQGQRPTAQVLADYTANHQALSDDLALADRITPVLAPAERIVAHGGSLPVIHDDGSVSMLHFAACPAV